MIKKIIKKIVEKMGYSLVKKEAEQRKSLQGALGQIVKFWNPDTVVDVGAAFGKWSLEADKIFQNSNYILVEPVAQYKDILIDLESKNRRFKYVNTAANSSSGEFEFNLHDDLVGSSLKKETEGENADGKQIKVKCDTLDNICKYNLNGNFLIKLDVQGAELDVLAGSEQVLNKTECLVMEVSLFKSFKDGIDFYDVIQFMKEKGFVIYDVFSFLYRPYDGALCQLDAIFVKENGLFRKFHGYATLEQRQKQNEKFVQKHKLLLK